MVETLNDFELTLLNKICANYPFLQSHIPLLWVESRKNTGVGLYVNFSYQNSEGSYQSIPASFSALSSVSSLRMEGLKYELAYEIAATNGKVDFLEVVTNGEDWDGTVRNFWFE